MTSYLRADAARLRANLPPKTAVSEELLLLYALLLRVKGAAVNASDVHDAWALWSDLQGQAGDDLLPYDDLPPEIQQRDSPYVEAIRRAADQPERGATLSPCG